MASDRQEDIARILDYIDPASLDYQEWVNVGMALKEAGHTASEWDSWSKRDPKRYNAGECFKKWDTFRGAAAPVTAGTIVQLAKDRGWRPERSIDESYELDWDSIIGTKDDLVVIPKGWVEGQDVTEPEEWSPTAQLIKYLETLFEANDNVGYVTQSWHKDGKDLPSAGVCDRTAGQLIQDLNKYKNDIGATIGDYNPEAGAWIRFNPLDGKGVKNINVTEFRYALVESDNTEIDKQNAIIRTLELPVACLVHSGKKSIHAIVKIDAANYEEYQKRVEFLYEVCRKNGLNVDTQNKNPSRLSRMPGIMRNGRKQYLIDTNIGKATWKEWREWIEGINDDLPDPVNMADIWGHIPDKKPVLIENLLLQGHKMLVAGPSKAGKSFLLIELATAIAEGKQWLKWKCAKGRVLYVNLELDDASCLHRIEDVYSALKWSPAHIENLDVWNLRGKAVPMDKLAPKLIRRAAKKNYIAIIIDPIYKVITGDENSADQMAAFCNQFDKVCAELGAAVIYCHHHSKGSQGGKRSMDRASGSGVFARDPDALLDLIELETNDKLTKQEANKAVCRVCNKYLTDHVNAWEDKVGQDDIFSEKAMMSHCEALLTQDIFKNLQKDAEEARRIVGERTAWRMDATLREFGKFNPVNLWFEYPIHTTEGTDNLKDVDPEGEKPAWQKAIEKRKPKESKSKERRESIETAYEACKFESEEVSISSLEEYLGLTKNSVKNRLREHGGFEIANGIVHKMGVKKQEIDTDT